MRKLPIVIMVSFSPFVASTAYAQQMPPLPPPVCLPASQAQTLVSWLAEAQALQVQILEASQAPQREAEIVRKARADQKAEDDAAAKTPAKPGG